jgi:UDPglucose 6-dehydrogenase
VCLKARILTAVHETNLAQKLVLGEKISGWYGGEVSGKRIAIWGLAFKPRTDDIRDAPAIDLIEQLLAGGASVRVHDPEAMGNVRALYGDRLEYAATPLDALDGADCLAIVTEWQEFRSPDFDAIRRALKNPVIFDGRNHLDPAALKALGFTYSGVGRA